MNCLSRGRDIYKISTIMEKLRRKFSLCSRRKSYTWKEMLAFKQFIHQSKNVLELNCMFSVMVSLASFLIFLFTLKSPPPTLLMTMTERNLSQSYTDSYKSLFRTRLEIVQAILLDSKIKIEQVLI